MGAFEITANIQAGIKHIKNWLQQNEYGLTEVESWQTGSVDIKADGKHAKIFVQVQTVEHPVAHRVLNGTDRFAVKDMAERFDRIPYIAYVVIDKDKNLVGDIVWERIG